MRTLCADLCWCGAGCRMCCLSPWGKLNSYGEAFARGRAIYGG